MEIDLKKILILFCNIWFNIFRTHTPLYYNTFEIKQGNLTGHPTTLEEKRFQDFLNSMDLILNSIQGHSTILSLK